MSARVCLVGICVAGAMAAGGQPLETVTISIVWDKEVIQHGETNTGKVIATVSPKIGDTVAWNTVPGTGQLGMIKAFASSIFDLVAVSNASKGKLEWTMPNTWNIANKSGTPAPDGGIQGVNAGQFPAGGVNPNPNTEQAPTILMLAWTEAAGSGVYDVLFASKLKSSKVYLDVGLSSWVGENAVKIDGQGGFSVVPGPGGWWRWSLRRAWWLGGDAGRCAYESSSAERGGRGVRGVGKCGGGAAHRDDRLHGGVGQGGDCARGDEHGACDRDDFA